MIRITVLDRHPAVRAGLEATISGRPGLAFAGGAADRHALWPLLHRSRPDVLLVEHDPGVADGLGVCLRVSSQPLGPRVVVWAADAGPGLVVPATLAGAATIVARTADLRELLHAVRVVAGGARALPGITPRLQARAAARLGPRDRAIFAMRLADTAPADIAATVGLHAGQVVARLQAIVAALADCEWAAGDGAVAERSGGAAADLAERAGEVPELAERAAGEIPELAARPVRLAA